MNQSAINQAWKNPNIRNPVDKLIMLCMAGYADEDGVCWPSRELIASRCGIDTSTVRRALNRLIAAGYITKKPGGGRGNKNSYQLHYSRGREIEPESKASNKPRQSAPVSEINPGAETGILCPPLNDKQGQQTPVYDDCYKESNSYIQTSLVNTLSSTTVIEGGGREGETPFHPQQQNIQTAEVETVIEAEVVGTASLSVVPAADPTPDEIYAAYPKKSGPRAAKDSIRAALIEIAGNRYDYDRESSETPAAWLLRKVMAYAASPAGRGVAEGEPDYRYSPKTFFDDGHYGDDPKLWMKENGNGQRSQSSVERNARQHSLLEEFIAYGTDSGASDGGDGPGDGAGDPGHAHRLRAQPTAGQRSAPPNPNMGRTVHALPGATGGIEGALHSYLREAQAAREVAFEFHPNATRLH